MAVSTKAPAYPDVVAAPANPADDHATMRRELETLIMTKPLPPLADLIAFATLHGSGFELNWHAGDDDDRDGGQGWEARWWVPNPRYDARSNHDHFFSPYNPIARHIQQRGYGETPEDALEWALVNMHNWLTNSKWLGPARRHR